MRRVLAAWGLAFLTATAIISAGFDGAVEQRMQNLRASILQKPASGEIVLVEIDAKSLQTLDRWPWPRSIYGTAINRLSDLGAEQIVFDIDFSARSNAEQDKLFAEAIESSNIAVVLPTFRQKDAANAERFVESLPIEQFRDNAFLASVNVHPDANGYLNSYSYGTMTDGTPRPSLASMLAESSGNIDKSFPIDQSIDPSTIPRLSFVDLLETNDVQQIVKGKKILIGATAIELGDRYPINRFGVIPGVLIQALAAETLLQSTDTINLGKWLSFIVAALLVLVLALIKRTSIAVLTRAPWLIALTLFASLLAFEYAGHITYSNVPAFFFLGTFLVFEKFFRTRSALNVSQHYNGISNLPNEVAFQKLIRKNAHPYIASVRIAEFRELLGLIDTEARADLFGNIADRLKFLALDDKIFHLESDILAWLVKDDYLEDIEAHFETASSLLHSSIMARGSKIRLDVTFGISRYAIDDAKVASEQARNAGKKWMWHNAEAASAIGEKQSLLVDLDQAIENGDITVVYQPKWDVMEDRLSGAEALVRWNHPERGNISPEIFIPLLEHARRMEEITLHVVRTALANLTDWETSRPGLNCAVNISAQLLADSEFVEKAIALVDAASVRNEQVTFEVTETATLVDPDLSVLALQHIRNASIKVSIDDYGTGQSTMSYLQRLPADEIKIDQSFVRTIVENESNQVLVKSAIEMAHALGFKVVAEGIEDQQCFDMLKKMQCDIVQGWHISKPVTPDVFETAWLGAPVSENRRSA